MQNVSLAFLFAVVGVPVAARRVRVTATIFNSLWGKSSLFFLAISIVGRPVAPDPDPKPQRSA